MKIRCWELKNLPKAPTPLKSVNFRRTTPGSSAILVSKYGPQPISHMFDPTYPGAHLSLTERHRLSPSWKSPHLDLYAFPKAFLNKPETQYLEPYKPRPYPAPPRRPEDRNVDMSLQVLALNSRIVLRPFVRTKIKRRLKEAIRLIVTRGAAVERSGTRPKVVFCPEDIGADKWIVPDWTYVALPTSEMYLMPFPELLDSMRHALQFLHRCIPEAERVLRYSARKDGRDNTLLDRPVGHRLSTGRPTFRAPSKGKPRIF